LLEDARRSNLRVDRRRWRNDTTQLQTLAAKADCELRRVVADAKADGVEPHEIDRWILVLQVDAGVWKPKPTFLELVAPLGKK